MTKKHPKIEIMLSYNEKSLIVKYSKIQEINIRDSAVVRLGTIIFSILHSMVAEKITTMCITIIFYNGPVPRFIPPNCIKSISGYRIPDTKLQTKKNN